MTTQLSPDTIYDLLGEPEVEEVSDHTTAYFYLNRQVVMLEVRGLSREGTDRYYEVANAYFDQQRGNNQPVFYLVDFQANISFAPHTRHKADEFLAKYKGTHGRSAYVFSKGLLTTILKGSLLMSQNRSWQGTLSFKEFKTRAEALMWLYEGWLAAQPPTT